mmetsp:Transcript_78439/g.204527  ORF Transcript_78439/g.204527 Transcript_78439/m.204527 type:complete len:204 (-) Transcript_78439:243-854(-)
MAGPFAAVPWAPRRSGRHWCRADPAAGGGAVQHAGDAAFPQPGRRGSPPATGAAALRGQLHGRSELPVLLGCFARPLHSERRGLLLPGCGRRGRGFLRGPAGSCSARRCARGAARACDHRHEPIWLGRAREGEPVHRCGVWRVPQRPLRADRRLGRRPWQCGGGAGHAAPGLPGVLRWQRRHGTLAQRRWVDHVEGSHRLVQT